MHFQLSICSRYKYFVAVGLGLAGYQRLVRLALEVVALAMQRMRCYHGFSSSSCCPKSLVACAVHVIDFSQCSCAFF